MKMKRLQPTKRLQNFLVWTIITCMLLGIQKMIYEETPPAFSPNDYNPAAPFFSKPENLSEEPHVVPFHPFEEGEPKMVVVLTYQRSGSTFFGKIFNQNRDAFYMFEPLDAFYSSFYGTSLKWNVPSDITSYQNGSERLLPENEIRGVAQFLASLLTCSLAELPAEALLHPYIYYYGTKEYEAAADFIRCIDKYQQLAIQCAARSPSDHCGFRFGERSDQRLQECHRALHDDDFRSKHKRKAEFEKYFKCMRSLKRIVDKKCLPLLQAKCDKRPLRVAKVVRATMSSMEQLFRQFPNFRLIHLIRDPRAVVLSRKAFDSSVRGLYADVDRNNPMPREAKVLCRTVARDVRLRLELERKYPGKIYQVIYDEMIRDLQQTAQNIYRFLDYQNPRNSSWWKRNIAPLKSKDSIVRAEKWQYVITFDKNKEICDQCQNLFQLVRSRYWLQ